MARRPIASVQDHLSDLQIKCIGLITAEWAHLEAMVCIAIWEYCGLEREKGLCVTADMPSLAKIHVLGALTKLYFASEQAALDRISDIVKRMEELNTQRNNIVHNLWSQNAMIGNMVTLKTSTRSAKLKESPLSYTDDQLVDLYQEIQIVIGDLHEFLVAHGFARPEDKDK